MRPTLSSTIRSALLLAAIPLAAACTDRPEDGGGADEPTPQAVDVPQDTAAAGEAPTQDTAIYCPPDKRYDHSMCLPCGFNWRECRNDL